MTKRSREQMGTYLLGITVLYLLAFAAAECNNGCSGHGMCTNYAMQFSTPSSSVQQNQLPPVVGSVTAKGYDTSIAKKDSCTCFVKSEGGKNVYAYTGADCSLMTCPYGQAWAAAPHANDEHTIMEECSGRGVCRRKTGMCVCFDGYSGKGCRRTTCPSDCSGHGVCKTIHEYTKSLSENAAWDTFAGYEYAAIKYDTAWDADRIRGCVCDAGFRGPDCSIKDAPSEADPMGGPGAESGRPCSGRGVNDNGECVCYIGFFGNACQTQRSNVV